MVQGTLPSSAEVEKDQLSLLGSTLYVDGLPGALTAAATVVTKLCERLESLDAHTGLFFLTHHTSAPRFMHILRSSPAFTNDDQLREIDFILRSTASSITNVEISDTGWTQASLPVRHGGLGLRAVADLALPCFISSVHASMNLVADILTSHTPQSLSFQREAEGLFSTVYGVGSVPSGDLTCTQRAWDQSQCLSKVETLLVGTNQLHRARLLAAASPGSGAWLQALPLPNLGLHLDDKAISINVALRLGEQICQPHKCRCGRMVDGLGHHGLSCRYSAGRLPRHANLNDVVKRGLAAAGIPSWLEPVGLDRGDGRRPDGLTVFPFSGGRSLCWDATCVDTFSGSSLIESAIRPGSAADLAEERKMDHYRSLLDRYRFEPLAIETTGVLGRRSAKFVEELGRRMSQNTGDRRETFWLRQRLSVAVARGNAAAIQATGPSN